jgi:hypothetical protein
MTTRGPLSFRVVSIGSLLFERSMRARRQSCDDEDQHSD